MSRVRPLVQKSEPQLFRNSEPFQPESNATEQVRRAARSMMVRTREIPVTMTVAQNQRKIFSKRLRNVSFISPLIAQQRDSRCLARP